ncbi:hypothetical protein Ae201684_015661 [Aphanomyces euteiches]|uniref:Uncharacterized protein n=1 Tax=Aphanomyces euteiches TaxID=100861 RepID=A0A6G0WG54_9STRA|nr:hypothetical protein Ae201684_015661 [Aphanomyces euteiches]
MYGSIQDIKPYNVWSHTTSGRFAEILQNDVAISLLMEISRPTSSKGWRIFLGISIPPEDPDVIHFCSFETKLNVHQYQEAERDPVPPFHLELMPFWTFFSRNPHH